MDHHTHHCQQSNSASFCDLRFITMVLWEGHNALSCHQKRPVTVFHRWSLFCQMPWAGVGVGLTALSCPTVLTQWFHCCRGKTLGLQIRLLPWSWRRYQVRRHQKGSPCSQWLPRWEEPLQKPTPLQPSSPSPSEPQQSLECLLTDLCCLTPHSSFKLSYLWFMQLLYGV